MRTVAMAGIVLAAAAGMSGQASLADAIGKSVSVQSVTVGTPPALVPDYIPVKVQLLNVSAKPVYAFKIKVVITLTDGTKTVSDSITDILALYVNAAEGPVQKSPPPIFRSGETYTYDAGTRVKKGKQHYWRDRIGFHDRFWRPHGPGLN